MKNEKIRKYQRLLMQYFKKSHPEKLRLNPRVLEVTKTHVKFGMQKHFGILSLHKITLESCFEIEHNIKT